MKKFHFVFGLRRQTEPFHLVHWLCLESCRRVNAPCEIHLHLQNEPWGPLWDRIRPHLQLHSLDAAGDLQRHARYAQTSEGQLIASAGWDYAHDADFVRMMALIEHGGIYVDMDTLFVRPYPDYFGDHDFAIGEEYPMPDTRRLLRPSLCNAVMFARPGARFARTWLEKMPEAFDGTWNNHSCALASALWAEHPAEVCILPAAAFYHFRADRRGLADLFERAAPLPDDAFSIHLWAHLWWDAWRVDFTQFHAGMITGDWLRQSPSPYATLARQWL